MRKRQPRVIDAEFTVITPRDDRPIWQRYKIEFDWPVVWGALALSVLSAFGPRLGGLLQ